jgi:thiazolinyl imide reductase
MLRFSMPLAAAGDPSWRQLMHALNRVLVCGSNYGRFYLSALKRAAGSYQLVGILARGSERSQRVAESYGVPLYQAADELPEGIDIACAAMSSDANAVVLQLLDRGIHVLWEHPQRPAAVQVALDRALQSRFHINGHFSELTAPQAFIRRCSQLCMAEPLRFLDVMMSDRTLYAGLDIVARATGHHQLELDRLTVTGQPNCMVEVRAAVADVPVRLLVQAAGSDDQVLEDGSSEYLLDCRAVAVFGSGVLTLLSLAGPVVWNRNGGLIQKPDEKMWSSLLEARTVTAAHFREQRDLANLAAIESLAIDIREGIVPPTQCSAYLIGISTAWEQLGRLLVLGSSPSRRLLCIRRSR